MNNKKVRVVFIGCVKFSKEIIDTLFTSDCIQIVGIITKRKSKFNSDFYSLASIAKKKSIPCLFYEKENDTQISIFLKELKIELGLCFGWSNIIKSSILNIPKLGFIGYHPADLPKNRGRHPIIWTIFLGLKSMTSTFFKMDKYIDGGEVIDKIKIKVSEKDNAESLYNKVCINAIKQIQKFLPKYLNGCIKLKKQNLSKGNYWRKRSKIDGIIDWRMNYNAIQNLVRALGKPYQGASTFYKNKEFTVWSITKGPKVKNNIEPGKIIRIHRQNILVKCWEMSIWITEHNFDMLPKESEYLE